MTALNVIIQADRVHLISDGAGTGADGKFAHLTHKVVPLPHLSAAVGVRGVQALRNASIDVVSACATSFDGLRANLGPTLRAAFEPHEAAWLKQFGPEFAKAEIVVAGWSERRGPTGFVLATSDTNAASGLPAWTPVDIPGAYFSPSNESLSAEFAPLQLDFDEARAVELIERQAALRSDVGGFVQISTVRRHAIESRILKNWIAA